MAELLNQIIPDVVARSDQLWRAFWETIQMVGISGAISLVLGIPYGASGLMAVLAASCLLALLHLGLRALCRKERPQRIPFAPYIFWGSLLYTLPLLPPFI